MGSTLFDLVAQKQADTQCTGDDARAIEQKIPWSYTTQQGVWSTLVQVGYCKIRLAGKYRQGDERVCNRHRQHSLQVYTFQSHNPFS
jgi:hypothetical protein